MTTNAEDLPTLSKQQEQNRSRDLNPDRIPTYLADHIVLWKGYITEIEIDAIVNAAGINLRGGSGVDGAIHTAAGSGLSKEENDKLPSPGEVGKAYITGGHKLPVKNIIHTIGPRGDNKDRETLLTACYQNCMDALVGKNLTSIAFPTISTGIFGYKKPDAAPVALRAIQSWMLKNLDKIDQLKVVFCLVGDEDQKIYPQIIKNFFPTLPIDRSGINQNNLFNALETVYFLTGGSITNSVVKRQNMTQQEIESNYSTFKGLVDKIDIIRRCLKVNAGDENKYLPRHLLAKAMQERDWEMASILIDGALACLKDEEKNPADRAEIVSLFLILISGTYSGNSEEKQKSSPTTKVKVGFLVLGPSTNEEMIKSLFDSFQPYLSPYKMDKLRIIDMDLKTQEDLDLYFAVYATASRVDETSLATQMSTFGKRKKMDG